MVKTILAAAIFGLSLSSYAQEEPQLYLNEYGEVVENDIAQVDFDADETVEFQEKSTSSSTLGGCNRVSPGSLWVQQESFLMSSCSAPGQWRIWINLDPAQWTSGETVNLCNNINPNPLYWQYMGQVTGAGVTLNRCVIYNPQNGIYYNGNFAHKFRRL